MDTNGLSASALNQFDLDGKHYERVQRKSELNTWS